MATRPGTRSDNNSRQTLISWTGLAATDDGDGVYVGDLDSLAAQAIGDATSVVMEGSMNGTTWAALGAGVTLTLAAGTSPVTALGMIPRYVRPRATGAGAGTAVHLSGTRRT